MEADWWKKGIGELIGAFTLVVGGAGSVLASNGNQLYAAFGHAFSIAAVGAAMSPGRWLGPAVASGFFDNWWVYWAGPLLGGILGAVVYEYVFRQKTEIPPA